MIRGFSKISNVCIFIELFIKKNASTSGQKLEDRVWRTQIGGHKLEDTDWRTEFGALRLEDRVCIALEGKV